MQLVWFRQTSSNVVRLRCPIQPLRHRQHQIWAHSSATGMLHGLWQSLSSLYCQLKVNSILLTVCTHHASLRHSSFPHRACLNVSFSVPGTGSSQTVTHARSKGFLPLQISMTFIPGFASRGSVVWFPHLQWKLRLLSFGLSSRVHLNSKECENEKKNGGGFLELGLTKKFLSGFSSPVNLDHLL